SISRLSLADATKATLYVSDSGTNEVTMFAWPKPKTGSALSGPFSEPQGMCSDNSGDVFITNTGDSNVLEYNGSKLVNTLLDPGEYPVGCSFDTVDGSLAVVNIRSTGGGASSVAIYKNAKGTPKLLNVKVLQSVYGVQYDGSGDLFADGSGTGSQIELAEMPAGSNKFKLVCPNGFHGGGVVAFPGGLGWDGKYLVIGDQDGGAVYRVKGCKIVGITKLDGSVDVVSFAIAGDRLVAPDPGAADVELYAYPKGGEPIQVLSGFSEPIGATVSQNVKGK
ncbi:MAG TPA: hypothetical protein VGK84_02970, partial [Candidatus Tumulicola sp.]